MLPGASGSCGKCGIEAPGGVQLVYWQPDAIRNQSVVTAPANEPYTIVENGFTFTSPSVYVVYSSLRATVTCGSSMLDTTGPSFEAKTIGYSSRFLAFGTLEIPGPNCNEYVVAGGFHTIDFSDLYNNPITTSMLYKPGCPPYANPRLSLPADLTTVDPAWASCEPLFYGAFDPPRWLKKASGGLVPSAPSQPTAIAAEGAVVSDVPAVAQATPAPVTPAPTATNNGLPSDPSPKAAPPAQNAGPLSLSQPPQALPVGPNTPAKAAEAAPASARQSTPEFLNPESLSPDQLSQLHQALQSTTPAEAAQPQVKPGISAVDSSVKNTPAIPVPAPGSPFSTNQQPPQEPDVAPKAVPDSQSVPPSVSGQAANAANPVAPETQNKPAPFLVNSGEGAEKGGNSQFLDNVGNARPMPALAQSMPKAQKDPSPVLVDPGNGALLEAKPNSPLIPVSAESYPPIPTTGNLKSAMPNVVDPGNGALMEGSSSNGAAIPAAVVYAAPGLDISQSAAAPHPSKVDGYPVDVPSPNGGVRAVVSGPTPLGDAQVIGDSNTVTGDPGAKQPPTPLVIGGETVQKASDGALLVAGQTVTPGTQATVSGAIVSVGSSNVIIDGTTHAYPLMLSKTATPLIVVGNTAQILPEGGLVVASQTITPGDQSTAPELPTPLVIGGQIAQKAPGGAFSFGSLTVTQGSQATISGHVVSVGASQLVVDSSTHLISPNTVGTDSSETPTPLSIAGYAVQMASDGGLVIASQTKPQGSQATISGHVISVGASELVVDASSRLMSPNTIGFDSSGTSTPLSIAGYGVQKASDRGLVIASQTISQGSQATISGIVVSAGTDNVVMNGTTHAFLPQFTGTATPDSVQDSMYTTANMAVTLRSGATFQSGGRLMTYTGSSISVLTEPTKAVVGTTTVPFRGSGTVSATSTPVVGGLIASAFGSGAAASSAASKANPDPASKQSGRARSGSARGAGVEEKSVRLLMTGIFALLGYIVATGLLG